MLMWFVNFAANLFQMLFYFLTIEIYSKDFNTFLMRLVVRTTKNYPLMTVIRE